jgi:drug/metabolite transporter (DMT)-like permease
MPSEQNLSAQDWLLLIILSVLWGGSFFFVAIAVTGLPPLTIVFLRVLIAAFLLLIVLRLAGIPLSLKGQALVAFFGMGLLNNVMPFNLIVWAQGSIPSGLASILNATTPLFTVLVLHLFTRDERATGWKIAGTVTGFAGVAVMLGADRLADSSLPLLPQCAMLLATLSYAFSGLWGRRFKALSIPPMMAAGGQLGASTLMMLPLVAFVERPWTLAMPAPSVLAAVVALAILSTALAYVLFFRILARAGATNLLLVTFLIPVSAILLGATLLGEVLAGRHFFGMGMIAIGLALIDGRIPTWLGLRRQGESR